MKASTTPATTPSAKRRAVSLLFGVEPIEGNQFRLAAVRWNGQTVEGYESSVIHTDNSSEVLKSMRYSLRSPLVLIVPRRLALTRIERVPTTDKTQIADMMRLRGRESVFGGEEQLFGYRILRTDEDGFSELLLMFVRTAEVESLIERLHVIGLMPTRVELSTLALGRLLAAPESAETWAVAHQGPGGFEYVRFSQGQPAFSRGVASTGSFEIFVTESMDVDRDGSSSIEKIVTMAIGGGDIPRELAKGESRIISLRDAKLPILNGVDTLPDTDVLVVGGAIGGAVAGIEDNLLPETIRRTLVLRKLRQTILFFAIALLATVGTAYALVEYSIRNEAAYVQTTRAALDELRSDVGDLDLQNDQLRRLGVEFATISLPLDVVLELYKITPDTVGVTRWNYNARGFMEMRGEAPGFDAVHEYLAALQASPYFLNVELQFSERPRNDATSLVNFRIEAEVVRRRPAMESSP